MMMIICNVTYVMQLVIETAGITDRLPILVSGIDLIKEIMMMMKNMIMIIIMMTMMMRTTFSTM